MERRRTDSMQVMHDARTTTIGGDAVGDIPFELVGKVAGAGAVAEAGDVERGSAARHSGRDVDDDGALGGEKELRAGRGPGVVERENVRLRETFHGNVMHAPRRATAPR